MRHLVNFSMGFLMLGASLGSGCSQTPADVPPADMSMSPPMVDASVTRISTIANARQNQVTSPIQVTAVVTAIRGSSAKNTKEWYIEDPAGGPYSGISVYCDKGATSSPCPMTITPPALHDLITVVGTIVPYNNKLELHPTALSTVMPNAPAPPVMTLSPAMLAPGGNSEMRGVVVQVAGSLTVDNVTPMSLYDTGCEGDGGVGNLCKGCSPPTYSGFQANDGANNEVLIENYFYSTDHLQNSPECLTQNGAIPVSVGKIFTMMRGVLDIDTYGGVQVISPPTDNDYALMP